MMKAITVVVLVFIGMLAGNFGAETCFAEETLNQEQTPGTQAVTPVANPQKAYPKIGVALAGGGARGFAHLGALKVLKELGIPIDYIAGTSMGSIVAGLYASGYSVEEMEQIMGQLNWEGFFSDSPPRDLWSYQAKRQSSKYLFGLGFTKDGLSMPQGLTSGQKISTLFSFLTMHVSDVPDFDHLPTPYRAVATDIVTGEEVVLDHGALSDAMRASMAVPGVFTPVEIDGRLLVDGGVVNNFPVDVAFAMGADIVIGIDVSSPLAEKKSLNNPFAILNQMVGLQIVNKTKRQAELADIFIYADLGDYTSASFTKSAEIAALGEKAARAHTAELQALAAKIRATRPGSRFVSAGLIDQLKDLYVEKIQIAGLDLQNRETPFLTYLRKIEGQTLDPMALKSVVERIFSTGAYDSVKFSLTPGTQPNAKILNLDIEEKTGNEPHLLRGGMYYDSRFDSHEADKMVMLLNMTLNDLTGKGSFWTTDLHFVNVDKIQTQYFQPLGKVFFVTPEFYKNDDYQVVYDGQGALGHYNLNDMGFTISLGTMVSRFGMLTAGYNFNEIEAKLTGNDSVLEGLGDYDERLTSLQVSRSIDHLDKFPFPHAGESLDVAYEWASAEFGGDVNFHKLTAQYRHYFPLAVRHTLGLNVRAGSDFDSELRPYAEFTLGGRDTFVGYKSDEIRGRNLGVFGVEYDYQLLKLPAPVGGNLYATLIGNVGNVWRDRKDVQDRLDLRYGGSFGLGLDSFLGRVSADIAFGDEGRRIFYLNIGYKF